VDFAMKLIGTYVSPYARRVAAALIACGIPYEHEDLNGYAQPARARELNPVGKVPVLILDDGERLIDSTAILDHLSELTGSAHVLAPRSGPARRATLRLSAIATTICEQVTARYAERQRPPGCASPELLERYRLQIVGGFSALDTAAGSAGLIGTERLDVAVISAVIAFEYTPRWCPDLDPVKIAPVLAAVAMTLADEPPFARTRPRS
jgi:glutathione S-transferase